MTDYKATPEQWHELERHSHGSQPWAPCILELRARVEALEANSSAGLASSNHPEKPDSSLVERVSTAIALEDEKHYWPGARDAVETDMARAAIREVAAWLRENYICGPANVIEQEAER